MGTMVVLLQKVLPVFLVLVFMILPFLLGYPLRWLIQSPSVAIRPSWWWYMRAAWWLIRCMRAFAAARTCRRLRPCLAAIALRVALQGVMILGMLLTVHHFIGSSRELDLAIIL